MVSGANGFLGSWVCRILSQKFEVIGLVRPKADVSRLGKIEQIQIREIEEIQFNKVISNLLPEVVILCDWWGVSNSLRNDYRQFSNVERFRSRISALNNVGTVIGVGSQAELGPKSSAIDEFEIDAPTTEYGRAKVEVRRLLEENLSADVRFIWSRIFSTYGPLDNDNWVIPSTILKLLTLQRVPLTKGEQEWSFLHSYDLGCAFEKMIETNKISGIVNVGDPSIVTISDVTLFIGECLKLEPLLDFGAIPYREDQVMKLAPITKKLCDAGWRPEVDLKNGILHLIDWMTGAENTQLKLNSGDLAELNLPSYVPIK